MVLPNYFQYIDTYTHGDVQKMQLGNNTIEYLDLKNFKRRILGVFFILSIF